MGKIVSRAERVLIVPLQQEAMCIKETDLIKMERNSDGRVKRVVAIRQNGRTFFTMGARAKEVLELVNKKYLEPEAFKHGEEKDNLLSLSLADLLGTGNRALDPKHANRFGNYLTEKVANNEPYIIPPIMLNVAESDVTYFVDADSAGADVSHGLLWIPATEGCFEPNMNIVDGLHRLSVFNNLAKVGKHNFVMHIIITCEADPMQTRADFADIAKTKPIDKSLQAAYSGNVTNKQYMQIYNDCGLEPFIKREGSVVSKLEAMQFLCTANGIKRVLVELLFSGQDSRVTKLTEAQESVGKGFLEALKVLPSWSAVMGKTATCASLRKEFTTSMQFLRMLAAACAKVYLETPRANQTALMQERKVIMNRLPTIGDFINFVIASGLVTRNAKSEAVWIAFGLCYTSKDNAGRPSTPVYSQSHIIKPAALKLITHVAEGCV